jgi:hypothetical protein
LDEQHEHQLLQIANKPYISILDVDFMRYRPPYLKEFCAEIDRLVEDGTEDVLGTIAEKFKQTVYTEVNFPYTYRPEADVRIDNDALLKYRRLHCNYKTKEEIRESRLVSIYLTIIIVFVFVLFHKM